MPAEKADTESADELIAFMDTEVQSELELVCSQATRDLLMKAAANDPQYQSLIKVIHTGWPTDVRNVPEQLRAYHTYCDQLSVVNNLVFKGPRFVVPEPARETLLQRLHSSHMGINALLRRCRDTFFYPGVTNDVTKMA